VSNRIAVRGISMFIRGIVLAAGMSSRMGRNKLGLMIGGVPIVNIVIENAKRSGLDEVMVVYGKYDVMTDARKVFNPRYEEGMSTSIIEGMRGFKGDGVMILLGDMPFVDYKIIDELISTFKRSEKNIVVPVFSGKNGNPVIIGSKYFTELLENSGDKGAREIIERNSFDIEWMEIERDVIFQDIDDESTFKKYK
jgi:molybdenum cofactor cytidylyltransferase